MDIFKLSKSLDELIYDVMMWMIFYPYTLIRVIFRPGKMIDYVSAELQKDPEDTNLFDQAISPPLFLFLSIVAGWLIAPDISVQLAAEENTAIGKAIAESSWDLLLFRLLIYCAFPLAGAVICEWRTPGGITRESFRKPFFQQAYLCGPLALVISLGMVLISIGKDELAAGITVLVMLAIMVWYILTQILFFRRMLQSSWLMSIIWGMLSVLTGIAIFSLAAFRAQ